MRTSAFSVGRTTGAAVSSVAWRGTANASKHAANECPATVLATAAMCLLLTLWPGGDSRAQMPGGEACKPETISRQKLVDFQTAFVAAEQRAKAWQADVVVARLVHTSLGPIDAEGRSSNWVMTFHSPKTKLTDSITIADGVITCWWSPNPAGRIPALAPNFYRDVKKLLAEAAAHGGAALMAEGFTPTLEMSAGSRAHAYWYVNYTHPQKRGSLQVMFDANSGKFESAIK
jgi:hypothetical protein